MINFDWLQPFIVVLASSDLRVFQQDYFLYKDELFQAKLACSNIDKRQGRLPKLPEFREQGYLIAVSVGKYARKQIY